MSTEHTTAEVVSAKESSTDESACGSPCFFDKLALVFGSILCRLWLGVRALQTGIEKYAGEKAVNAEVEAGGASTGLYAGSSVKEYSMAAYHGVPETMMEQFKAEPLMLKFALPLYDMVLGPALILMGLTLILGVGTRISYLAQGLLYISLTWGLILLNQASGVAWLGTHMILIVMGLALAKYDRFVILKKW